VTDAAGNTVMRTLELAYTPAVVTLSATLNGGDRTLAVINAEMAVVEYTASAGIPSAALTNAPTGVSGSFTGNTFSVYGTPTEAGTFTYTVALDIEKDDHCAIATTGVLEVENCTNCAVWAGNCSGIKYVSNVQSEGQMNWSSATATCAGKGEEWRLPTIYELMCMCPLRSTLPGDYVNTGYYWSSTADSAFYYRVYFGSCASPSSSNRNSNFHVKCVK
jgi:hypothetical protein